MGKVCKGFVWVGSGEGDNCLLSREFLVYNHLLSSCRGSGRLILNCCTLTHTDSQFIPHECCLSDVIQKFCYHGNLT